VYGVGSEDMDTLTFGSPILLRHMTASEAKKLPISEISLEQTLEGLDMSMAQFIDMCILLGTMPQYKTFLSWYLIGCDYCESIKGIGPHKAIKMIQDYGSIDELVNHLDTKKYAIPENWPLDEVRRLFTHPDVLPTEEATALLKWTGPREEALVIYTSSFSIKFKTAAID
jgi:flap endonuclease-1